MSIIVTSITHLRLASFVNITNAIEAWQPYIDEAEQLFVRPVLGAEFFDSFADYLSPNDEISQKLAKTISLYALYLGADEFAVSISGQGIQVVETETHKTAPAYRVQNLKESWLRRAHTAMDDALAFLEDNYLLFPEYVSQEKGLFLFNAKMFNEYVDIRESRRVYIALKPTMRSIEKKYIKPTLTEDLYTDLKTRVNGGFLDTGDQELLDMIRPAVAHLTMARALHDISIDTLDWGVFDNAQNTFNSIQSKQEANKERIHLMAQACQLDGEAEMKELQEYLDNNASATLYADYFNSDRYVGPDTASTRNEFENSEDNGIFVV